MSIFGLYFVNGLLREAGWPRNQGFFKKQVIATVILDGAIDQLIDWAAALGAERPTLALQMIAEMFRDRDWSGDDKPNIKAFIEKARKEHESWRITEPIAPHDVAQPTRFTTTPVADVKASAGDLARRHFEQLVNAKALKEMRPVLEHFCLVGLLFGMGNPKAFVRWHHAQFGDLTKNFEFMRESGLAIEPPTDLPQLLADSEQILRNYERDINPLPAIPASLLADARALGLEINGYAVTKAGRATDSFDAAVLEILSEGGTWMPSSIVGRLRSKFEPSSVRPLLEDMHPRRLIASHAHAYCLPENVETIRAHHFKTLQKQGGAGIARGQPDSEESEQFERTWRAVENWDGFGDKNLDLCAFKSVRFRRE